MIFKFFKQVDDQRNLKTKLNALLTQYKTGNTQEALKQM